MKSKLNDFDFEDFKLECGKKIFVKLTYQIFGLPINEGPVVVINHSLTGDSNVTGVHGWWNKLIGKNKMIDTDRFCVICINVPGNIKHKNDFNYGNKWILKDVAKLFVSLLNILKIKKIHSVIGGSIGGGLVWEMGLLKPKYFENLIPIAADYKASDWLIANTFLQKKILNNSKEPIIDARIHAMITYRNPLSLNKRFKLEFNNTNNRKVADWLSYHGNKLNNIMSLKAYLHMNNLLSTIGVNYTNQSEFFQLVKNISSEIHLVAIDSDLLFPSFEIKNSYNVISKIKKNISYYEIKSDHGHDAFLMEFDKMKKKISKIFEY